MEAAKKAFYVVMVVVLILFVVWIILNPDNLPALLQWMVYWVCVIFGIIFANFPTNLIGFAILLFIILWLVFSLRGARGGGAH